MRLFLPLFMLVSFLSFPLLAKEHVAIEHTTIMDAGCALQNKKDMQPGCKKNSDAFMKAWHSQAKPLLNALSSILSQSNAERIELLLTVNHSGRVEIISISQSMKKGAVKKVKALLADMRFTLIKGNEFKLKVRTEKRKT